MDRQIIEIMNDGFALSLHRGFLVVENKTSQIRQEIPLDNILALLLSANNINLTAVFQADIRQKTIAGDSSGDDGSQDGVGIIQ